MPKCYAQAMIHLERRFSAPLVNRSHLNEVCRARRAPAIRKANVHMNDLKVYHWTGWCGLIGVVLFAVELPLWVLPGSPPPINDAVGHSQFLASIRVIALARVLLDMGMYICLMVFFAGFRYLIVKTRSEYEWVGTLALVAGAVWWAVSLVADGLEGGAILDTVGGKTDPAVVRALVEGTLLIYNGSIAFAVTGLFMAVAGFAILATNALPRWIGWLAWTSVVCCVAAIPSMYANIVDHTGFYNVAGWGPALIANVPPLIWFLASSLSLIRKR